MAETRLPIGRRQPLPAVSTGSPARSSGSNATAAFRPRRWRCSTRPSAKDQRVPMTPSWSRWQHPSVIGGIESLIQGAWLRGYHEWEKATVLRWPPPPNGGADSTGRASCRVSGAPLTWIGCVLSWRCSRPCPKPSLRSLMATMLTHEAIEPALQTAGQVETRPVDGEDESIVDDTGVEPVRQDQLDAPRAALAVLPLLPFVDPGEAMPASAGRLADRGRDRCRLQPV
jgi:hypothetical protein